MKTKPVILLFILSFTLAKAQTHYVALSEFKFNGLYGQYRDDTTTIFSLICNDWKNKTYNADSLINHWLLTHPDATYRPVCSFSYYRDAKRKTFTYGWIVSGEDNTNTLNLYLVRHGACPANTMLWAPARKEMSPRSDVYHDPGVETKVFINGQTYREFLKKLKAAEKIAQNN
jgi:hypothetical protein